MELMNVFYDNNAGTTGNTILPGSIKIGQTWRIAAATRSKRHDAFLDLTVTEEKKTCQN